MNTVSSDFKFFIEYDLNPFFIFDSNGKLLYLNQSAEYVINETSTKELFELALRYAPQNYGNKITHMDVSFGFLNFYAFNVLYANDDEIALHLYDKPIDNLTQSNKLEGFSKTDIIVLLNAHLELFKMDYKGDIKFFVDLDLPKFYLNQNLISILFRKTFNIFINSNYLHIELKLKIGEKVLINKKRYQILNLKLSSDKRDTCCDKDIKDIAAKNFINSSIGENSISFEIPFIS